MSNVEFNEEVSSINTNSSTQTKNAPLVKWFIKKGWVKDEKSAQTLMIAVTVICFGIAFYLLFA